MKTTLLKSNDIDITKASQLLSDGKLVAIPTETVYGLAADATNISAINKIFEVKKRPQSHPLILHLKSIEQINDWATDIPSDVHILAKHFWPGPISLLLKKHSGAPTEITGGSDKICIRIPDHPVTLSLLTIFNKGIVAPSANLFGRVSPTSAKHVLDDLDGKISAILDGGQCKVGLESTIIDLTQTQPRIVRPGGLPIDDIEKVLNKKILTHLNFEEKIPGNVLNHYQPRASVHAYEKSHIEQLINDILKNKSILLHLSDVDNKSIDTRQMPKDAYQYGQVFYSTLRLMDDKKYEKIYIELPPETLEWHTIHDRIKKASFKL
ncbi:MAG: threonylcarbamoyl-AMP synthase [Betaproteobacteria bacterium]|nr:threonylcarbamoyl-AMP synthase [Betaproteobacteria bacterium]